MQGLTEPRTSDAREIATAAAYQHHPSSFLLFVAQIVVIQPPTETLTMRKEERFILRKMVFSICETFRKILRSSFSRSMLARRVDAEPWKIVCMIIVVEMNWFIVHSVALQKG